MRNDKKYSFGEKFINKEQAYLFRITHFSNLPFILKYGLHCKNSRTQDPNFMPIGKEDIISKRDSYEVDIVPFGVLSDYIPFYFAPRSPMLYDVYTNPKISIPQNEIIYLVTRAKIITDAQRKYIYTDGHPIMKHTNYDNDIKYFNLIDWDVFRLKYWTNTPEDDDIKRKRMAEFLVYNYLPIKYIKMIGVYDESTKKQVEDFLQKATNEIIVQVRKNWYY